MIYRLARSINLHMRHRFVAEGSAIILMGPDRQRAILDIVESEVIVDGEDLSGEWGDFLQGFTQEAECKMRPTQDEPEPRSDLSPDW